MDVVIATVFAVLAGAGTASLAVRAAGPAGRRSRPARPAGGGGRSASRSGSPATFAFATVLLAYVLDALGLPGRPRCATLAIAVLAASASRSWCRRLAARRSRRGCSRRGGAERRAAAATASAPASCSGRRSASSTRPARGRSSPPCWRSAAQSSPRSGSCSASPTASGAAIALLAVMLPAGARSRAGSARATPGGCSRRSGVLMVAVAVLLAAGLDRDFRPRSRTTSRPRSSIPTSSLEETGAVTLAGAGARGRAGPTRRRAARRRPAAPGRRDGAGVHRHAALAQHPAGQEPSCAKLRGRVVLVDFWTYTCINCLRTLPHLKAWDSRYRAAGLSIVGVHTPEFAFERRGQRRATRSRRTACATRSALDNDYGIWNAWQNQYWPAKYLIDARGQVRYGTSARATTTRPSARSARCSPRRAGARRGHRRRGAGGRGRAGRHDAGDLPRLGARPAGDPDGRARLRPRDGPRRRPTGSRTAGLEARARARRRRHGRAHRPARRRPPRLPRPRLAGSHAAGAGAAGRPAAARSPRRARRARRRGRGRRAAVVPAAWTSAGSSGGSSRSSSTPAWRATPSRSGSSRRDVNDVEPGRSRRTAVSAG